MIKVEVIEPFTLQKFTEIKNLKRKEPNNENIEKNTLYFGDIFECNQEMAEYLIEKNALKRAFVKIIEIKPELEDEEKKKINQNKKRTVAKKEKV